jgi:hypothetical protein
MATHIPDSLERLTQADLIGVVRDLIGEVGRLRAENEKVNFALTQLYAIHEDIFGNEIDPDEARAKVKAMLAGLPTDDETMGAVLHEAREIARARHFEFEVRRSNDDTERVVGVMDGATEPMIAWLEVNGPPPIPHSTLGNFEVVDRADWACSRPDCIA